MSVCAITDFVYQCRCGKPCAGGGWGVAWQRQSPHRTSAGSRNLTLPSEPTQDAPGHGPVSAVICRSAWLAKSAPLTSDGTLAAIVATMRDGRRSFCAMPPPARPPGSPDQIEAGSRGSGAGGSDPCVLVDICCRPIAGAGVVWRGCITAGRGGPAWSFRGMRDVRNSGSR